MVFGCRVGRGGRPFNESHGASELAVNELNALLRRLPAPNLRQHPGVTRSTADAAARLARRQSRTSLRTPQARRIFLARPENGLSPST